MERVRPIPATPVPPLTLVRRVKELHALLDEVRRLSEAADLWAMRVLDQHVRIALSSPVTLARPANQLDFVDGLVEAVWDALEAGFGGLRPGATAEETGRRQERLSAVATRLEEIVDELLQQVAEWDRRRFRPG